MENIQKLYKALFWSGKPVRTTIILTAWNQQETTQNNNRTAPSSTVSYDTVIMVLFVSENVPLPLHLLKNRGLKLWYTFPQSALGPNTHISNPNRYILPLGWCKCCYYYSKRMITCYCSYTCGNLSAVPVIAGSGTQTQTQEEHYLCINSTKGRETLVT